VADPLSERVTPLAGIGDALGQVVEWVGNALRDAFQWIDDAVATPDVVEWALLALGLLLLWRAFQLLRTGKVLGPITIADLTNPPKDVDGQRLAALMRERLASAGVAPEAEIPVGRPDLDLEAVVKSSPIPQAQWFAAVFNFIQALLRRFTGFGFRAEGTLQSREGESTCGITVALSQSATGKVLKMTTFWANSFEEVVEQAAFWVYIQVVDAEKSRQLLEPWQHWSDPEALRLYQKGNDMEVRNPAEALNDFRQAAKRDERNVLPWLAIANVCERLASQAALASDPTEARAPLLEAVARYQEVAHLWPDQVEARYRLANLCAFRETWEQAWGDSPANDPRINRLQLLIGKIDPPTPQTIVNSLLNHSLAEYDQLIADLQGNSGPYERMTRVARMCTQIQLTPEACDSHVKEVETILKEDVRDWNSKYNAACFYALAVQYADEETAPRYADRALALLDEVLTNPETSLPIGWVTSEDPDLQPLRDWLAVQPFAPSGQADQRRATWMAVFSQAM
jgi:tetratricopeptide (TPR) repeat protein